MKSTIVIKKIIYLNTKKANYILKVEQNTHPISKVTIKFNFFETVDV